MVGDAELVAAALGNRAGFAAIYDRYADRLYDFCVGMLRDQEAAADCVQEVFCTAATRLGQLREPDKLRPWLYAIARRQALACIQARQREQPADELPEDTDGQPDLAVLAARTELTELVRHAAGGLSERDQTLLELHYHHGLDGPELATALGVSATNANTMLGRLRTTVDRSLGAFLLARRAHRGHSDCPELTRLVGGWDGHFTVLTRKRIARHLDSCAGCHTERARVVNARALLGASPVLLPAPAWLREHTLNQVPTSPALPPPLPAGTGPDPAAAVPPRNSTSSPDRRQDVGPEPARTPVARHRSPRTAAGGRRAPQTAKLAAAAGVGAAAAALAMTLAAPSPATPTALAVPVAEHTLTRAVTLPPSVATRPGHESTVTVAAPPAARTETVSRGAPPPSTVTVTAAPVAGPTRTVHDPAPPPRTVTRTVTETVKVDSGKGGVKACKPKNDCPTGNSEK